MPSRPRTIAERLASAWSSGDAEGIAALFTEDCLYEDVCAGRVFRGSEALKTEVRSVLAAIPDLRLQVTAAFGEGDWIGAEWIETGTLGGRRFSLRGASIAVLKGDRLSRESFYAHFDGATWIDP